MLNQISFFHLDNLIKSRVPFLFINMAGEDLSTGYTSIYKTHVEANQKMVHPDMVLKEYLNPAVSKDTAIVLLCNDGAKSQEIATEFEKNGYTNVYVMDGGFQQLVTERS